MTQATGKGQHTDYVKRQYIGNLGKIENGIVAVTAGLSLIILRFLCLRSTNPKNDLNQRIATSKPEIAAGMMRDLKGDFGSA